jgi:hypothetical protein
MKASTSRTHDSPNAGTILLTNSASDAIVYIVLRPICLDRDSPRIGSGSPSLAALRVLYSTILVNNFAELSMEEFDDQAI